MATTARTVHRRRHALACIASGLILSASIAAVGPPATAAAAPTPPSVPLMGLEIRDAWIRWLPSGLPAAGYMTLVNSSDRPLELTAVSSEAYRDISLHHSETRDGMSHMEAVHVISVPAHAALSFAGTGYHLMLMQPTHPIAPGDHVALTLQFAGGAARTVSFEVRAPNGSAAQSDMKGMQGMHDMPGMHSPPPPTPR